MPVTEHAHPAADTDEEAPFLLGVLQNGFTPLGYSSYVQTTALGVALIVAVLPDQTAKALERD